MENKNQYKPYFPYIFLFFLVARFLVQRLNLDLIFDKVINITFNIVIVTFIAIQSRNQSRKVKALLLFTTVSTCIILFALYFGIINIDNIDVNVIIFVLSLPIVIILIAIFYKTLNQIIQYYRYK